MTIKKKRRRKKCSNSTVGFFHNDLLYYWIILENIYVRTIKFLSSALTFFLFVSVSQLLNICNRSFLFLPQFSIWHDPQTYTLTHAYSFSQHRECQPTGSIFSCSLFASFFFFSSFQINHKICSLPKKNRILRVLSALCTSAHCRSLAFFSSLHYYPCSCSSFSYHHP